MRKIQEQLLQKILCNPTIEKWVENKVMAFFVETITRLIARNPQYVNILNWITFVLTAASYIASKLLVTTGLLTPHELVILGQFVPILTGALFVFGQIPVQPKVVDSNDGIVIKQAVEATRPFTAISEKIQANAVVTQGKAETNEKG